MPGSWMDPEGRVHRWLPRYVHHPDPFDVPVAVHLKTLAQQSKEAPQRTKKINLVVTAEMGSDRYEEVYMALGKIIPVMRWIGLFPVVEDRRLGPGAASLTFRWVWVVHGVFLCMVNLASAYTAYASYIKFLPDALEVIMMTAFVIIFFNAASLNVAWCCQRAQHWPHFFRRWRRLDRSLGVQLDPQLRAFGRFLERAMVAYAVFELASLMMVGVYMHYFPQYTKHGFEFTVTTFGYIISPQHIMPELLFTYICRATILRLRLIANDLVRLYDRCSVTLTTTDRGRNDDGGNGTEIGDNIEHLRMAFQVLMEGVRHTNIIMGPMLMNMALFSTYVLTQMVYLFAQQAATNVGITMLKLSLCALALIRLFCACLVANELQVETKKVSQVLYRAPSLRLSQKSRREVYFFLEVIRNSSPHFTGMGFVIIGKDFISTVVSVVISYTITINEFDQEI